MGNSGQGQSTTNKILASGLAPTITENDMRKYFKQFDKIIIVVVMYDPETQAPWGFNFIMFDLEDVVDIFVKNSLMSSMGRW